MSMVGCEEVTTLFGNKRFDTCVEEITTQAILDRVSSVLGCPNKTSTIQNWGNLVGVSLSCNKIKRVKNKFEPFR